MKKTNKVGADSNDTEIENCKNIAISLLTK